MPDYLTAIDRYGLPIAFLLFLAIASVYIGRFAANQIIVPVRDKLIDRTMKFFDRLEGAVDRMEQRDAKLAVNLAAYGEVLYRIESVVLDVEQSCTKMESHLLGGVTPRRHRQPHRHQPSPPPAPPADAPKP